MAQIEQGGGDGKKKKGAQKKMSIHVDFTPMVDMNMLLITFFMLCTTMLKSQTLKITLPDKAEDNQQEQDMTKVNKDEAITLLLDAERDANGEVIRDASGNAVASVIYYYTGKPDTVAVNINKETFMTDTAGVAAGNEQVGMKINQVRGIRKILYTYLDNYEVVDAIAKLKEQWATGEFGHGIAADTTFQAKAKALRTGEERKHPVVIIKPMDDAAWETLIAMLDEMDINQIARYQIDPLNHQDSVLLQLKGYRRFK